MISCYFKLRVECDWKASASLTSLISSLMIRSHSVYCIWCCRFEFWRIARLCMRAVPRRLGASVWCQGRTCKLTISVRVFRHIYNLRSRRKFTLPGVLYHLCPRIRSNENAFTYFCNFLSDLFFHLLLLKETERCFRFSFTNGQDGVGPQEDFKWGFSWPGWLMQVRWELEHQEWGPTLRDRKFCLVWRAAGTCRVRFSSEGYSTQSFHALMLTRSFMPCNDNWRGEIYAERAISAYAMWLQPFQRNILG